MRAGYAPFRSHRCSPENGCADLTSPRASSATPVTLEPRPLNLSASQDTELRLTIVDTTVYTVTVLEMYQDVI